ncbi:MAG: acyl-CoA thioesterase, partial [Metallibacterium scheffleri]
MSPTQASPRKRRGKVAAQPTSTPATSSPEPAQPLFTAILMVRWRDLDAFNHVNNSVFLTYLEEARLQWLKDVPGPWFDAHAMP